MLDSLAAWLMLPLGIALGWYIARREGRPAEGRAARVGAYSGLGELVNDDADGAIAALVRATEADDQSLELHLNLGSLFRRRGEVDRALRVHEALLQRGTLTPEESEQVRYELAQDYLAAGLMDRAETLFNQLALQGRHAVPALEALVSIYEQAHDWRQAIDAAERLQSVSGEPRHAVIAHYWCELADEALRAKNADEAAQLGRRALDAWADSARASLTLAKALEAQGDAAGAVKSLLRVAEQDARYFPEAVEPLLRCAHITGDVPDLIDFLREQDAEHPSSANVLAQATLMREAGMNPARFLAESFAANPSWALLEQLLDAISPPPDESMALAARSLREALRSAAGSRIRYRCGSCGLTPGLLFWQCPSCKQWGTVTPVDARLG